MNFAGKVALVTGGTRGIGAAIVAELRERDATVYTWGQDVDVRDVNAVEIAVGNIGHIHASPCRE